MLVPDPVRRDAVQAGFAAGPGFALGLSGALLALTFAISVAALPAPLVLPAICIVALAIAALYALIGWSGRASNRPHRTYWDVAGALTLIGMAAAIFSEPDQVIALLELAPGDEAPTG